MSEIPQHLESEASRDFRLMPRREDFGEGELGDKIFLLISKGATCEVKGQIIPDTRGKREVCGFKATHALNYADGLGEEEFVLSCSGVHTLQAKAEISEDLQLIGRRSEFGINGYKFYI